MKKIAVMVLAVLATTAFAQTGNSHHRQGYVTKNGTYVAPSYSTSPNETKLDNYSSKGNINPYTGKAGTVDPYKVEPLKVEPYKAYKPPKY